MTKYGGVYECRASSKVGSVSHSEPLNIKGAPFVRSMDPVKVSNDVVLLDIKYVFYGFDGNETTFGYSFENPQKAHHISSFISFSLSEPVDLIVLNYDDYFRLWRANL